MALQIAISPDVSEVFHRLVAALDDVVYDRSPRAYPYLDEFTISGTGAIAGDTIEILRNETALLQVLANSSGDYSCVFEPTYEDTNIIRARKAKGTIPETYDYSNLIILDVYKFYVILYLLSKKYLEIQQAVAQSKQNLYIQDRVGDLLEPLFKTEKDSYSTMFFALKDIMPLKLPTSVWAGDKKALVEKAVEISNKGPVHASIMALESVLAGIGIQKVFLYPLENFKTFDNRWNIMPRVKPGFTDTLLVPKERLERVGWDIGYVTYSADKEVIFVTGGSEPYRWVYLDGSLDVDGTLKVFQSAIQPLPGASGITITIAPSLVRTDDQDGSVTGIPLQKYVELSPPAYGLSYTFSVSDDLGPCTAAYMVNREVLSLGRAVVSGSVTISYTAYIEAIILCVVKLTFPGPVISEIHRSWDVPGHVRPDNPNIRGNTELYLRYNSALNLTAEAYTILGDIIETIKIISMPLYGFIGPSNADQLNQDEDSQWWCHYFKGFKYWKQLA